MISFACAGCGRRLKVNDEAAGKKSKCPQCGEALRVPAASQPSAVKAPAAGGGAEPRTLPPRPTKSAADLETKSAATLSGGPDGGGPSPEQYDFLAPPQAPDELGRLGPYRVLQVLGAGGMGVVFRAEDPMLKRPVALKAMLPALAASESSKKRFLREAQAVAAIDHDHIVHVYQVGEDRGVPFLAMQFLRGEPLDERLKREPRLPVAEAVRIGAEVALGLGAAHAAGLIHRDVKPANVWLEGEGGRVKVLDFGLARAASQEAGLTQTGAIVGTPAYMAPEQANSQPVDARTDLFSLGCVLYQMTTGERPFKGTDTLSTLMAVAMDQPRPPAEVRPEVPAALSELIMRLLSKDPGGRPQSAAAVVEALKGIDVGRARKGGAEGEGGPEAPTRGGRPGRPRAKGAPKRRPTKRVLLAVAAGAIAATTLVVLLIAWGLSKPGSRSQTGPVGVVNNPSTNTDGKAAPEVVVNAPSPNADGRAAPPPVVKGPELPPSALSFETGWDKPVDPDGDCKFTFDKTALTIEAPAKYHALSVNHGKNNAPRLLRDVEGDFTAQVMVSGDFFPTGPPTGGTPEVQVSAGLVVMDGDLTYGQLEQKGVLASDGRHPMCFTIWGLFNDQGKRDFGMPVVSSAPALAPPDGKPKYLRVERKANRLLAADSADGAQWVKFKDLGEPLHARLKLGVFIATSSSAPFKARFEDFRLTKEGPIVNSPPPVVQGPESSSSALSFETGWDTPVDPDGDCKFTPDKTALTIEAPAKYHDLAVDGRKKNAPRFLRDVEGDFTAQVMVNSDFFPTAPSTDGTPQARVSAGLVVMNDDQTYGVLEQTANLINRNPICFTSWGWCSGKGGNFGLPPPSASRPAPPDGKPKHFRLTRNGNGLLAASSADGAQWVEFSEMKVPLHARLKLGVFIATSSSAPFKARFEDFRLTAGGVNPAAPADQPPPEARGPADDAWVKATAALPAEEQVRAVAAKLKQLNPGFDGVLSPGIDRGVVFGLQFSAKKVTDISPLRVLTGLRVLNCSQQKNAPLSDVSALKGMPLRDLDFSNTSVSDLAPLTGMPLQRLNIHNTQVSDLSPLKGMPLKTLWFGNTQVSDLSPLKGMPLTDLSCGWTMVSDLSPLKGMPLTRLDCQSCARVSDLSPLKGMPLTTLMCGNTAVSDLSPLKGTPLKELFYDYNPERDAAILRSIPTLESINNKPAKDVLNDVKAK